MTPEQKTLIYFLQGAYGLGAQGDRDNFEQLVKEAEQEFIAKSEVNEIITYFVQGAYGLGAQKDKAGFEKLVEELVDLIK